MWPFGRAAEHRSEDATEVRVDEIERAYHAGSTNADELAITEAAVGLWQRAIASASIMPMSAPLEPVTAECLALAGRGLAARGEAVFEIVVDEQVGVKLVPASGWDIYGNADPATWTYRLDHIGPSRTSTVTVSGAAVIHFRVNCDPRSPWRGRSPLRVAQATGRLAAQTERALYLEMKSPVGQLSMLPSLGNELGALRMKIESANGFFAALSSGQSRPTAKDERLVSGEALNPARFGPKPDEITEAIRKGVGHDILASYGISPVLFAQAGDGTGQREAWRRFWASTITPIGAMIQTELRAKLDGAATIEFPSLRASDEDGRSRAIARRAAAYKVLKDAGIDRDRALQMAGLE